MQAVISYLILVSRSEVRGGREEIRRGRRERPRKLNEEQMWRWLCISLLILKKDWGRSVEDEMWRTKIAHRLAAFSRCNTWTLSVGIRETCCNELQQCVCNPYISACIFAVLHHPPPPPHASAECLYSPTVYNQIALIARNIQKKTDDSHVFKGGRRQKRKYIRKII